MSEGLACNCSMITGINLLIKKIDTGIDKTRAFSFFFFKIK